MIPAHDPSTGNLPPGEHPAEWRDVVERFGTTPWRSQLLEGLAHALRDLRAAGCKRAYIDVVHRWQRLNHLAALVCLFYPSE